MLLFYIIIQYLDRVHTLWHRCESCVAHLMRPCGWECSCVRRGRTGSCRRNHSSSYCWYCHLHHHQQQHKHCRLSGCSSGRASTSPISFKWKWTVKNTILTNDRPNCFRDERESFNHIYRIINEYIMIVGSATHPPHCCAFSLQPATLETERGIFSSFLLDDLIE